MFDSIQVQEKIEVLKRCLNDAKPQDEKMAGMLRFANIRQISLIQLINELKMVKLILGQHTWRKFLHF